MDLCRFIVGRCTASGNSSTIQISTTLVMIPAAISQCSTMAGAV
jgi:hypothetical protein